ncbi:hypothetical protein PHMEG_00033205 [Phytophthora megakarya]|uniref:PX domain-containing protein n=1 Tax=Phytophthora megakarya TaxID=4795 RepID=A0A225UU75_9STRA|nr:hypothetical protein PHMEG_00033205 [Phytophthora megakarya]
MGDCGPVVVNQHNAVVEANARTTHNSEFQLQLDSDAHRRWKAPFALEFLKTVSHVDIQKTRSSEDGAVLYKLEVHLQSTNQSDSKSTTACETLTSYLLERSFTDFENLRQKVHDVVTALPQCPCQYCFDFILYIRYKFKQPRSMVKLSTGVDKRKQILSTFVNEFVVMAKRRVQKSGKRKCQAQELVPIILEAFLVP